MRPTPDRLGFLITNMSGGGAERVISSLARGLSNHPSELLLFEEEMVYPFEGRVHIIDVPILRPTRAHRRLWGMSRGLFRLGRLKKDSALDTCVSFLTWPNLFNILSRRNERVVISVRNNPSLAIRGRLAPSVKALMRKLYPRADHIVAISEDVRRDLIENFGIAPERVTTIYNPVRLQELRDDAKAPLPEEFAGMEDYPTVVSVGRLVVQKGHWHLIRAFPGVKEKIPEARLMLVGTGPCQEYLIDLARQTGLKVWVKGESRGRALDADVIFSGFVQNPFPLVKAAKVFAFPSLWEGLGNVLIESLALGLPVVSAACHSGPREILAPETTLEAKIEEPEWARYGVLMPVCDGRQYDGAAALRREERLWSEVLVQLLNDPQVRKRYAQRGKERARDFALENIIEQWRSVLFSLQQG